MMRILKALILGWLVTVAGWAQPAGTHYDESKVPAYTLPDPLNGVKSASDWKKRRAEILDLFTGQMYGRSPGKPAKLSFEPVNIEKAALGGKALRKIVMLRMEHEGKKLEAELLLYLPADAKGRVPVFAGLNFGGNHAVTRETDIPVSRQWMRNNPAQGVENNRATEKSRGSESSRWALERILERGYGVATMYYGDIDPDFDDGFSNGVHGFMGGRRAEDSWGSVAAWAWGLSRMMDYLATDSGVDRDRVAVMGHSRLGKAALWAGAVDERFAIVISNNSGCGGAALSRRAFGETVNRMNTSFPHWFALNFRQYNDRESELPFDQHMLLALMAPRPVYVASAVEDQWADPRGEFLSAVHAGPVYRLLGKQDLSVKDMPALNQPVMRTIGYHIREGKHDVTLYDWERYMDFADLHWRKK
jgi:hypothetical protein